ncbi:hypothetical protein [Streptomyces sp. GESEQ-35]|uniref:hypothetical protein n=1 Tax=Streptomyces sp. GESEQ-35 TaxID=2812657 RepID=UPI001B3318E6|nr:hypothetical protein [Streptomyces sp. GESEQ-35]
MTASLGQLLGLSKCALRRNGHAEGRYGNLVDVTTFLRRHYWQIIRDLCVDVDRALFVIKARSLEEACQPPAIITNPPHALSIKETDRNQ